ncbi:MAG: ferritin family protein [Spirochaetes bacterium]|nr:ferritin family protein [Spirochaetota bacterium]
MELKEALEQAMKAEIEGRELYRIASERTVDEKAKEAFAYLSREEDSHFEALKRLYGSYLSGERMRVETLPRLIDFSDAKSPIFSETFKKQLAGKHWEMSVLSIAMRLERDSVRFYQALAGEQEAFSDRVLLNGKTDPVELRKFFLELAEWERSHLDSLQHEIALLQDDYWEENNFVPF